MTSDKEYGPGIYFGMPFEEYCTIPALNASGIKNLLVSGLNYWTFSPMNPYRTDIDDETKAKIEGRAYHKRILEGKEAFDLVYAVDFELDPNETDVLNTTDDIKAALLKMGLGVGFKTKGEGAARLISANPKAKIRHVMEARHRNQYPGREFISARLHRHIEFQNKAIQSNPHLRAWLAGGQPEVTVIWYDEEYGVLMKARFDYLKLTHATDLKSYANQRDKSIKKAIMDTIASYKYYIQASHYMRGQDAARALAAEGIIFGDVNKKWISAFADSQTEDFRFIFIEKGDVPNSTGRTFIKGSGFDKHGTAMIRQAVNTYHQFMDSNGALVPWFDTSPPETLELDEMPAWGNDI